jgi:hypothetical protein
VPVLNVLVIVAAALVNAYLVERVWKAVRNGHLRVSIYRKVSLKRFKLHVRLHELLGSMECVIDFEQMVLFAKADLHSLVFQVTEDEKKSDPELTGVTFDEKWQMECSVRRFDGPRWEVAEPLARKWVPFPEYEVQRMESAYQVFTHQFVPSLRTNSNTWGPQVTICFFRSGRRSERTVRRSSSRSNSAPTRRAPVAPSDRSRTAEAALKSEAPAGADAAPRPRSAPEARRRSE